MGTSRRPCSLPVNLDNSTPLQRCCCRHWCGVTGLEGVVETLSRLLDEVLLVALLLFEVSLTVALDVLEFVAKCAEVSSN